MGRRSVAVRSSPGANSAGGGSASAQSEPGHVLEVSNIERPECGVPRERAGCDRHVGLAPSCTRDLTV